MESAARHLRRERPGGSRPNLPTGLRPLCEDLIAFRSRQTESHCRSPLVPLTSHRVRTLSRPDRRAPYVGRHGTVQNAFCFDRDPTPENARDFLLLLSIALPATRFDRADNKLVQTAERALKPFPRDPSPARAAASHPEMLTTSPHTTHRNACHPENVRFRPYTPTWPPRFDRSRSRLQQRRTEHQDFAYRVEQRACNSPSQFCSHACSGPHFLSTPKRGCHLDRS